MFERLWDGLVNILIAICLPAFCWYHAITENLFLNVSIKPSSGLEKGANTLLVPFQYLFAGKEAVQNEDGSWKITQKFEYTQNLFPKTMASIALLPTSLILGSSLKALSFLSSKTKERYASLSEHVRSTKTKSNALLYRQMGMEIGNLETAPFIESLGYQRRPGDENHMLKAKECLRDIAKVFNEDNIPWWVDCGTLLGAYRYGGIIPWDYDIDIAVLLPDHENVRRSLNRLDPAKYMVQDWSGRDFPDTFFKVYVRETKDLIDIYFYKIDANEKVCQYIFALDHNIFFFEWYKKGERRFERPAPFDHIFPLKKAMFDGIEVLVPNKIIPFLQRYYGENLSPVKIYDPRTNRFEKDLNHPYWQIPNVH